jgi:hypothetical protein
VGSGWDLLGAEGSWSGHISRSLGTGSWLLERHSPLLAWMVSYAPSQRSGCSDTGKEENGKVDGQIHSKCIYYTARLSRSYALHHAVCDKDRSPIRHTHTCTRMPLAHIHVHAHTLMHRHIHTHTYTHAHTHTLARSVADPQRHLARVWSSSSNRPWLQGQLHRP